MAGIILPASPTIGSASNRAPFGSESMFRKTVARELNPINSASEQCSSLLFQVALEFMQYAKHHKKKSGRSLQIDTTLYPRLIYARI